MAAWSCREEGFTDSEASSENGSDNEADGWPDEDVVVVDVTPELRKLQNMRKDGGNFIRVEQQVPYPDTALDRGTEGGTCIFSQATGFGRPARSRHVVMTFYDADCPYYYVGLDTEKLKIQYSMEDGLPLGYLLHKNIIVELLEAVSKREEEGGEEAMAALRDKLLAWIADVLRSPLSDDLKSWVLRKVETQGRNPQMPPVSNTSSLIIAYSLCNRCPSSSPEAQFLRRILTQSLTSAGFGITPTIEKFIRRKEQYGIYVVKGGTLFQLQNVFGKANVAVRDYEREVSQRAVSINWMYLEITRLFTGSTCIVYIQGLRLVEDALLKWLAEYTKYHPWRFVFFENVDTSWNFSENRDRCNFSFAPEMLSATIRSTADLSNPRIVMAKPSHITEYSHCPPAGLCRGDVAGLLAFFRRSFPCDFLEELPTSSMARDFREELSSLLEIPDPCVVMVVSPPGAGKTFAMDELTQRLASTERVAVEQFDCSSDVLVTHTITELLDRAVAAQGERVLLILDEYHMLDEEKKAQLFEWVEERAAGLQVVLIANRIDSKDRERVQACTLGARLIETRLTRTVLEEKLLASGGTEARREKVLLWYACCRLVFGEESISCRLVDPISEALGQQRPQQRLTEILIGKVPTISHTSADQFVAAFLARSQGGASSGGPFASLFNVAAMDEANDDACSFHEFSQRMPRSLFFAPPGVRLLCWSAYMAGLKAKQAGGAAPLPSGASLAAIVEYEYVDQVGTPFQLCEAASCNLSRGRAFSWAGDYESLDSIIDATKRGHSIDWNDLHERNWKRTTITEGDKVCVLLSACRNPGACLEALTPANIALLLRTSSPESAVTLARHVLKNRVHERSSEALCHRALWALMLNDCTVSSPSQLAEASDFVISAEIWSAQEEATPMVPRLLAAMEWAQENAGDDRQTSSALSATSRDDLLRRTLVLATLRGGGSPEQQGQLWSGVFAQLLTTPTEASEAAWESPADHQVLDTALPVSCLRQWLSLKEAHERTWPVEVRNLWSLLHCKAPASVLNALWAKNRVLLCTPGSQKLVPLTLSGIVHHEGGELDKELQHSLLTCGCTMPPGITDDDLLRVADAALRFLEPKDVPVGSDQRVVELVAREAARRASG